MVFVSFLINFRNVFMFKTYTVQNCNIIQASTLTYFSTCPFGQLTKKSTCPTQSFSCPKKLIKITKTREKLSRAPTTFRKPTGRSGIQQREAGRLLGEVNHD